jgi:hypothetical protein
MKKLIGPSALAVFLVLFCGLVYGVDEDAVMVSATDIWFPENVIAWTFQLPDGNQSRVWVWRNSINSIQETRPVFGDSPFSSFWVENGNIFGDGNEYVKSLWGSTFMNTFGVSFKEVQDMKRTSKFFSPDWLLIPAQLSDGLSWDVVKYEFTNP